MVQGIPGPVVEQTRDPDTTLTLDYARERLRFLLADAQRNAWEIGDLLNRIEKSGLVRKMGYRKTKSWLEAVVPEAKGKKSTLYRYANVASQYSKAHIDRWGVAKLYCLMIHDEETQNLTPLRDPAEREVQLLQPDGSMLVKKFRDCTCRELRLSQRRKTSTDPEPAMRQDGEDANRPQDSDKTSAPSIEFLKEQVARVARRSRKLLWPFTPAG